MQDENKLGPVARRLAATQRVLCVEDEPDIASFLRAYFRAAGYDLVHLDPMDADEVVAAVEEHRPDCILLDLRLRTFSGTEAYRLLRADERWAFVPVIMVSAYAESDPAFEKSKGLDAFVAKPFNTNVLADLVRDRIAAATVLSERGRHHDLAVMTHEYLEARLADEIAVSGDEGTFSFALIRLRSRAEVVAEVGESGLDHLVATLVSSARDQLPGGAVIGLTDSDELAIIFPALDIDRAHDALEQALRTATGSFEFPGGASVPVTVVSGLAAYPASAVDTGGLFMAADSAMAEAVEAGELLRRAL